MTDKRHIFSSTEQEGLRLNLPQLVHTLRISKPLRLWSQSRRTRIPSWSGREYYGIGDLATNKYPERYCRDYRHTLLSLVSIQHWAEIAYIRQYHFLSIFRLLIDARLLTHVKVSEAHRSACRILYQYCGAKVPNIPQTESPQRSCGSSKSSGILKSFTVLKSACVISS